MAEAATTAAATTAELVGSLGRSSQEEDLSWAVAQPCSRLYRWQPGVAGATGQEVVTAVYRQIMVGYQGDIPGAWRLPEAEHRLAQGDLTVQGLIAELIASPAYQDRFVKVYPLAKLVTIVGRQLLGRDVSPGSDYQAYLAIAETQGVIAMAQAMQASQEYQRYFGDQGVPYHRG
jgi:phycobilisome core-membrane linker protein